MALINASSAIIAKVRSKYGKRLREKDYRTLVKCRSVDEIVQVLRSSTRYADDLERVGSGVHRGNLENILREKQFESFLSLCKYNTGASPVTAYLLRQTEIGELMKMITLLSVGRPQEYIFSLPLYFLRHAEIDLKKLSSVRGYGELLSVTAATPYRQIIRDHPPDEKGDYDLAAIEVAMDNTNLKLLYDSFKGIKSKKEREQLVELFGTLADYSNYSRILRLKRYYHMSNDAIRAHLLRYGSFTGRQLDALLKHEKPEELSEALAQTRVGKQAHRASEEVDMASDGRFRLCRHQLYFSVNPEIVLLAYSILAETELNNLIAVIEGVRYAVAPENIFETLIL